MSNKRGASKIFSEQEIKQLEANPNVQKVTDKTITYAPEFKVEAVKAYEAGQTPMDIFLGRVLTSTPLDTKSQRKAYMLAKYLCCPWRGLSFRGATRERKCGQTANKQLVHRRKTEACRSAHQVA